MNKKYRKAVVAGNWKMNCTPQQTKEFIIRLKSLISKAKHCDIILAVPAVCIPAAVKAAKSSKIEIAAQNCHYEASGAYTGEISCPMIASAGAKYVIVGHSERRSMFGEDDRMIARKVEAALSAGLRPILCVGETLEERTCDTTMDVIRTQLKTALAEVDVTSLRRLIIAYEPVWAIGTGRTATPLDASRVIEEIRACLREKYGARPARSVSILYGGSVNVQNSRSLFTMPDIDGGLVGGASLDPDSFAQIIEVTKDE